MNYEMDLIKKITLKIIPALIVLYILAFIDRSAVGFAQIHMGADVGISDAAYGLGAGLFFIGYFLFEIPSNLMMHKYGARKWFTRILLTWGLITMAMMFIQGPKSFYILRFLLGVAEAGFFPGVLYYITKWFPVRHRGKVMGTFILAQPIALMSSGILAGFLLGMDGIADLKGWQWLFLVVGLPAVLLALPTYLYLPDRPSDVKWLSSDEKQWIHNQLEKDETEYGQVKHGNPLSSLKDKRVLLLSLFYIPSTLSVYGLGLWLPMIVKSLGSHSDIETGFLSSIPYVCAILGLLIFPKLSDKKKDRYGPIAFLYIFGGISLFLSAYLTVATYQLVALSFAGFFLFSINPIFWTLPSRFLTGASAAAGIALINSVGNLGGYIGPYGIGLLKQYTGQASSGLYLLSGVMILGFILTFIVNKALEKHDTTQTNSSTALNQD